MSALEKNPSYFLTADVFYEQPLNLFSGYLFYFNLQTKNEFEIFTQDNFKHKHIHALAKLSPAERIDPYKV